MSKAFSSYHLQELLAAPKAKSFVEAPAQMRQTASISETTRLADSSAPCMNPGQRDV
jgi:hypothetical protein